MLTNFIATFGATFAETPACSRTFFGLKPWFHYLQADSECNIVNFNVLSDGGSDLMLIALALVDDMLRVAGFVAIAFLIYGGFLYITSQGSADQTAKAQSTIQNSLLGLVVAVISISFVTFLGNRLG